MVFAWLLACGGTNPCGDAGTEVEGRCIGTLSISSCADLPAPRDHLGVVAVVSGGENWLLATGGLDFGASGVEAVRAKSTVYAGQITDGTVAAWTTLALPQGLAGHGIAALGERIYFAGGLQDFGDEPQPSAANWTARVFSMTFSGGALSDLREEAELPTALWHIQARSFDGRIVAVGGRTGGGSADTMSVEATLDGSGAITGWTPFTALSRGTTHHGLEVTADRVLIAGGLGEQNVAVRRIEVGPLDGGGDFEAFATLENGRITPAVFRLGEVLFVGGGLSATDALDSVEAIPLGATPWTIETDELRAAVGHIHQVPVVDDVAFILGGRRLDGSSNLCSTARLSPTE